MLSMLRGSESIRGGVPAHPLYHAKRAFLAHWCLGITRRFKPPTRRQGARCLACAAGQDECRGACAVKGSSARLPCCMVRSDGTSRHPHVAQFSSMQLSSLMGSNWFYAVLAGSYSEGFLSRGTIVTYLPPLLRLASITGRRL